MVGWLCFVERIDGPVNLKNNVQIYREIEERKRNSKNDKEESSQNFSLFSTDPLKTLQQSQVATITAKPKGNKIREFASPRGNI